MLTPQQKAMMAVDIDAVNPPALGSRIPGGTDWVVHYICVGNMGPVGIPAKVNEQGQCIGGFYPQEFCDAWNKAHPQNDTFIPQTMLMCEAGEVEARIADLKAQGATVLYYGPADAFHRDETSGRTVPNGYRVELVTVDPGYAKIGRLVRVVSLQQ